MVQIIIMFLRRLINNNPQLVEKLAESYPIRRAAQLFVYMYSKNKSALEFKNLSEIEGKVTEKLKKICEDLEKQKQKQDQK